jgi:hypothetical protein
MIGFKTMVIRTNYTKTISYMPWQYYDIKNADAIEVRDFQTNELLATVDPTDILGSSKKVWIRDPNGDRVLSDYFVADFTPGDDFKPQPKRIKTVLRRKTK